jgi:hypothetical protein
MLFLKRLFRRCHEKGCWKKGLSVTFLDMNEKSDIRELFAGKHAKPAFSYFQCEPHMHQQLTDPDSMSLKIAGRCRTCIGEKKVNVRKFLDEHGKTTVSYSPAFKGKPDGPHIPVIDCPRCTR